MNNLTLFVFLPQQKKILIQPAGESTRENKIPPSQLCLRFGYSTTKADSLPYRAGQDQWKPSSTSILI